MKTHTLKKHVSPRSNSRTKTRRKTIKSVHENKPLVKHLRLISTKHTGKVVPVRHSSYLALLFMLIFVGFLLFVNQNIVGASGGVSVGVVVNGPPPSVGAEITSPASGFNIVNINPTQVTGTCAKDTFVVVYNDGTLTSSTICKADGTFVVNVQLRVGRNVLTAKNFDNLNQAGPTTPDVILTLTSELVADDIRQPVLPDNPLIIPGVTSGISECANYQAPTYLPTGGQPHVAVVCVPRSIEKNAIHEVGLLVWGGVPPYALSLNWGSGGSTLLSIEQPGYRTVKVHYANFGIYNIYAQIVDRSSNVATGESAIQVTDPNSVGPHTIGQFVDDVFKTSWLQTPVPLYVTAVGFTLGFWVGDIFNRRFGAKMLQKRLSKRM